MFEISGVRLPKQAKKGWESSRVAVGKFEYLQRSCSINLNYFACTNLFEALSRLFGYPFVLGFPSYFKLVFSVSRGTLPGNLDQ